MIKPDIAFEYKPVFEIGNPVRIKETGMTGVITSAEDGRDMTNQFRPDWKDGMDYGVNDSYADYKWWELELITNKG